MHQSLTTNRLNILVVDDDEDFSELLVSCLNKIPHAAVSLANSTDEAVKELSQHRFDLIVSDWVLDDGDSPQVFDQVDKLIPECSSKQPILFMSSCDRLRAMRELNRYSHFQPLSFILKRFGPSLISLLAENALDEADFNDDGKPKRFGAFQTDGAENKDLKTQD